MNIVTIIQARMSSTRLPGKVMMKIDNKPLLYYINNRLKKIKSITNIVIATSTDSSDDIIEKYCIKNSISCFRGSLQNVLNRFYYTAKQYKADIIIRITADCPLIDPFIINKGINIFILNNIDYLSNTIKRTYPRGFDFEIMTFKTLERAFKKSHCNFEKEHVTPYIYKTAPKKFKLYNLAQKQDFSKYQLTVDTIEDFKLLKLLITKYKAHLLNHLHITKILEKNSKLLLINQNIKRIII